MATLSELLANLDPNNYVRGRQFEHICKWYLENEPKYRMELKKVWLWKEWPDRWGPDAGIDLVAKTYDDKLWAIQAKAYDDKYSIKKTDVDTFLSESSREVFSFRLLIATTNLVGQTAERTLHDQEKPVGQILFSDIEKSEVIWPASPDKLETRFQEQKKPRPHQEKAISDLCKGFYEHNRGQLMMACGTGKTLVSLWTAEKLQSQRTLILLPSLSLLAQTLREWTANTSHDFHYLPVCSDDTVRDADHFISRTGELGFPVTTSPDEVTEFLRKQGHIVVFSTYQSSPVIAEVFTRDNVQSFDLVIADEAHRCAGVGTGPFTTILDSNAIKTKKLLFMTATPRIFSDCVHKNARQADIDIASMDDENKFGPVFHLLTFSEAIKQDLLTDYQVVIIAVDNATYQEYAEKETFVTFDGQTITDARTFASQIALAKGMRKYNLQRIISFHGRIKRAKEFSKQLPDVVRWMPKESRPTGKLWSEHVSGEMTSSRRDVLLNRFRHLDDGERGLLTNARCLGEGVDLPTLDGVAFIDPRHSQVDIVQAVGRVMRKAPDKKIGTVVLPVFIDTEQDSKIALESSAFKPIWDVLKALRAHDDVLADALDQIRRQLGRNGMAKLNMPDKLVVDIPVAVGESFVKSLNLRIVEQSTASWPFWFGLLENYVKQKGDYLVSKSYVTDDGYNLGSWVAMRRHFYKQGKLSVEQQKALEQLPGWVWDIHNQSWGIGFEYLCEYVKHEGHTNVTRRYVDKDGYKLGLWVMFYRQRYKQERLSKERRLALERLPGWTWSPRKSEEQRWNQVWNEGLECLRKYVESEGHASVPGKYITEDGYNLRSWVSAQRQFYRQGKLSAERQKTLEQLPGWVWGEKHKIGITWSDSLKYLQEYVKREGHTSVPSNFVTEDGYNLGAWVRDQRYYYKKVKRKLSAERRKALDQLPGWMLVGKKKKGVWEKGLEHLRKYAESEGHVSVPWKYVTEDGYNLGFWVAKQRQYYKQGKLSAERQKALEQLPGWVWSIRKTIDKNDG